MGRRKRDEFDGTLAVVQLAALFGVLCVLQPQLRQIVLGFGALAIGCGVLFVLGWVVVRTIAMSTRQRPDRETLRKRVLEVRDLSQTSNGNDLNEPEVFPASSPTHPQLHSLTERLRSIDWFQFEKLIAALYRRLGYSVTRSGGANPDGGIDLIISKEGIRTAVQCKHWKNQIVGVSTIREFLGALTDSKMEKGVFVTLRGYSAEAKRFARKHTIETLDETSVVAMLKKVNAEVDLEITDILNNTTKYCPKCEHLMVLRTGAHQRSQFWGCSNFPRCWGKLPYP